jgi:multidrug efflux pump subunit AcrA (membrane-fusion protein)
MLPQKPPAAVVRAIAWLLIALFAVITVVAFTVRFPETIRCSFVLAPEGGADPVQSPVLAAVQSVKAREGGEVAAGAELVVLRSDEIRSWQTELRTRQEELRAVQERHGKLEDLFKAQVGIKDEELKQVEREVTFREKHLATCRDFYGRNKKLAVDQLVSEVELIRAELEVAASEKDLNVAQRTLQQVTLQRQQIETERARQRAEEDSEAQKLKYRIEALNRQLENCSGDTMTIRAPYHAVVVSLAHRNEGTVVRNGDELCQLAPVDGQLRARLALPESGAPRVAPGQRLRLFFEAFPYQRYGSVTGNLEWISPAAIQSQEGHYFPAQAKLDQSAFTSSGQSKPLRAGMRGEAHLMVGSRTIAESVFEPIRQLREQTQR